MLTGGRGGGNICQNLADVICKRSLMARCGHLNDPRQHGFLKNKLVDFCDSVSLSLNSNIRSDHKCHLF